MKLVIVTLVLQQLLSNSRGRRPAVGQNLMSKQKAKNSVPVWARDGLALIDVFFFVLVNSNTVSPLGRPDK